MSDPPSQTNLVTEQLVICKDCNRSFRDLKCHKCLSGRAKPISEQRGAVQCEHCQRWMKSAGGLAVHQKKCNLPIFCCGGPCDPDG